MRHWDEIEFWRRSAHFWRTWFWFAAFQAMLGWVVVLWLAVGR